MTDKTAFDKWWLDEHGPNWKAGYTEWEKDRCQEGWNAAIYAALDKCKEVYQWEHDRDDGEECEKQIQKLRSE